MHKSVQSFKISIASLLIVAAGCSETSGPNSSANYDLLFVNEEKGVPGEDIFRMNADGTGRENLTKLSKVPYRITFSSNTTGSDDIYLIKPDGTGIVNLTNTSNANEVRALWVERR